jgi:hypothetical protein
VLRLLSIVVVVAAVSTQGMFNVFWSTKEKKAVTVYGAGLTQSVIECLDSSRQSRVKIEVRVCRRNPAWFDSCRPNRSGLNTIEFDPITESYRVVSDLFGDNADPASIGIPSRIEAVEVVLQTRAIPLEYLAQEDTTVVQEKGTYIQVRATTSCRGSVNRFFANVSQILTLGMLDVVESTTDWHDFTLASDISTPASEP